MGSDGAVQFNIHEAKTNLSRIVEQVEQGTEVIISRAGTPVAKLVPLDRKVHRTARGSLRGRLVLPEDWDAAEVNDQIADAFGMPK